LLLQIIRRSSRDLPVPTAYFARRSQRVLAASWPRFYANSPVYPENHRRRQSARCVPQRFGFHGHSPHDSRQPLWGHPAISCQSVAHTHSPARRSQEYDHGSHKSLAFTWWFCQLDLAPFDLLIWLPPPVESTPARPVFSYNNFLPAACSNLSFAYFFCALSTF